MQATRRDLCGWGMGYPVVLSLVMRGGYDVTYVCVAASGPCACWSACLPVLSVRRSILSYLLARLFFFFFFFLTSLGYASM